MAGGRRGRRAPRPDLRPASAAGAGPVERGGRARARASTSSCVDERRPGANSGRLDERRPGASAAASTSGSSVDERRPGRAAAGLARAAAAWTAGVAFLIFILVSRGG